MLTFPIVRLFLNPVGELDGLAAQQRIVEHLRLVHDAELEDGGLVNAQSEHLVPLRGAGLLLHSGAALQIAIDHQLRVDVRMLAEEAADAIQFSADN